MNISLPGPMKVFVDEQIAERGYGTVSEYVRELIRKDRELQQVRALLLEGARSGPGPVVDTAYLEGLRARARRGDRTG
ncbi:type II toxin-antitoxin system ParD family antitoxin [uncultured Maricaulis sp.]|uniref:ribbon-helix-helix domain-containing protein n=1 Tax=uncultured Maricaulis sp. TaxID=174710 RepID=UPI0030D9D5B7|tara:strand:+ start:26901 stop:27134 length:234 start_codon:yes stop_codon:yes gene_type:complete